MDDAKVVDYLVGACVSGFALIVGWSFKNVWDDKAKSITDAAIAISELENKLDTLVKEIELRVNELEKTDAGVQVHLDSLAEVKKQLESVQIAVLNFVTHRGSDRG